MEAAGGVNNAYTNSDVTVYTDWFPRSALETIFQIEASRFGGLEFIPATVESERNVVLSERRSSTDDQNQWFQEQEFFRFCYHFALENALNHTPKMQNYVALFRR